MIAKGLIRNLPETVKETRAKIGISVNNYRIHENAEGI